MTVMQIYNLEATCDDCGKKKVFQSKYKGSYERHSLPDGWKEHRTYYEGNHGRDYHCNKSDICQDCAKKSKWKEDVRP